MWRCSSRNLKTPPHPNPPRDRTVETASRLLGPVPHPGPSFPASTAPDLPQSLRPGVPRFPRNPQVHGPFQSADSFRTNFLKFSVEYLKPLQSTPQPLPHGVLDPEQWRPHQPPLPSGDRRTGEAACRRVPTSSSAIGSRRTPLPVPIGLFWQTGLLSQ